MRYTLRPKDRSKGGEDIGGPRREQSSVNALRPVGLGSGKSFSVSQCCGKLGGGSDEAVGVVGKGQTLRRCVQS